ncbi:Crp/Fnr family transcriptional regulator [Saccharothrix sp. 6-C]|uniref:Crp/Fnr family transcriptional regulator n=1 Tax=Saccharothrix sp. 6-C TaxID=2781735 RepID=UPI001F2DF185|nr:Crp/Fnr family transcriptional regulator [Saccharothrix sp. 6-C]
MSERVANQPTAVEHLVEESSFGADDAVGLRDRAPREVVEGIVSRVNRQALAAFPARESFALGATPTPDRRRVGYSRPTGPAHGLAAMAAAVTQATPGWPGHSLLGRLRDNTRQALLNIGTVVRYGPDREIMEQDATDTHALLLLDGVVKVQATDETGDTALLAIRVAGDLVGEMAALDRKPRSATVVTCGDVVAKLITSGELMGFLHRHNDVFVELIAMINDRLRWANQRRRDYLSHTAAERVARVLAELVLTYGREEAQGWTLGIPLTKVELASIAGMKPRTAEKAFSDLRKAGVVVSHLRRDVLVPDLVALQKFGRW